MILLRICDSCNEENSDDALVCKECGDKLPAKQRKINGSSNFYSKKVLLVVFMIVIIFVGLYFSNFFGGETTIEVEAPEILIERVTINQMERDWLLNDTWQVSSTVYFKILNSNTFEINITDIEFSVDLIDNDIPMPIYFGSFNGGIVPYEGSLSLGESFWFLAEDEGIEGLESDDLHFNVSGIALFLVETSSSYQEGYIQFNSEV